MASINSKKTEEHLKKAEEEIWQSMILSEDVHYTHEFLKIQKAIIKISKEFKSDFL